MASKEETQMINRIRKVELAQVVSIAMLVLLLGCGADLDETDDFGLLESGIQALDTRLQSHHATVTGILNSLENRNVAMGGVSLEAQTKVIGLGTLDEDWEAIHREWENYGEDMHRILNELGETVTMIGACQMMMGGMMFGTPNAENTCLCEPYMDTSIEEVDQHLSEMLTWMNQQDTPNLWGEMDRHWELMRSQIQDMDSHMQKVYGSHGGMMGMM
jgi:hypothetical protein